MKFDQQDEQLQRYLQKLLEVQRDSEQPELDEAELKRIALYEVGMTPQQWEEVQQNYQQHFQRGQSFAEFGNWKEAIEEYEQALALRPNQLPLLYELGAAYKNLFSDSLDRNDRRRAEFYAKKCLHLDPQFSKASQLLQDVQIIAKRLQQKPKGGGFFQGRNLVALILILLVAGTVATIVIFPGSPSVPLVEANSEPPVRENVPAVVEKPSGSQYMTLPVQWQAEENQVKELHRLEATYRRLAGGMTVKARGWALVPEKKELEILQVQASLMAEGQLVAQKSFDVYPDYRPALRPSDPIPIGINWYFKEAPTDKPTQLQITVQNMKAVPAPRRYKPAEAYPLLDENNQPQEGLKLHMRKTSYNRFGHHKISFELDNQTGEHIGNLQLRFSYFNRKGEELASNVYHVVSGQGPMLRDGEQLVWGVTQRFRDPKSKEQAAQLQIQIEQRGR